MLLYQIFNGNSESSHDEKCVLYKLSCTSETLCHFLGGVIKVKVYLNYKNWLCK
jgi:hypothetical protein